MPPIFNKRAELEARLGPSGTDRQPEAVDLGDEKPGEELDREFSEPTGGDTRERLVEPLKLPEVGRTPRVWAEGEGTVLAPGTMLEGTLRASEPVVIAGTLQGTLEAEGPVTVQEGGRLVARVVAPELVVSGFLDGRVQVHGRLEVRATGLVKGKLHVGTLRIEEGALLDGQLQMAGASTAASVQGADLPTDLPRPRTSKTARAVDAILSDALEPMAVNE